MLQMFGRARVMAACLLAFAAIVPATRADGIDDFSLLKAIPADVAVAGASRSHSGQDFITGQYQRVWDEFDKARIDRDIKVFLKQMAQDAGADVEQFEKGWQKMSDMASLVDWSKLAGKERAFGMRIALPNEFVLLLNPSDGKAKESFDGLAGIAKQLSEMSEGALALATEDSEGVTIHRLSVPVSPIPLALTLALKKDTILIGFGSGLPEQTLALLSGKPGDSIVNSPRFKDALKRVPAPKDSVNFCDNAKLMKQIDEVVGTAMGMIPTPPPDSPEYKEMSKAMKLPKKILDMFDFTDMSISTAVTDGKKSTSTSVTVMRSDAKTHAMYDIFYGNEPLKDALKFVPKGASEFSVSSGIDVAKLYAVVMSFLKENMPDPEELLSAMNEFKTVTGFDLEKDVLGTFQGGMVTFKVAGPTAYAKGQQVFMLRVKDEAKAKALLDKIVTEAKANMSSEQGSIVDADIEGTTGFKTLQLGAPFSMWIDKPTFGVANGWLIFGMPADGIKAAMETAAGKSDNASKNERVTKEGLLPESGADVMALSFSDDTQWAESIATVLGMAGMVSMFNQELAKEPGVRFALGLASKLSRIVRTMDFYQSSASRTTMKDNVATEVKVINFRESPAGKRSTGTKPGDDAKPADGKKKPE